MDLMQASGATSFLVHLFGQAEGKAEVKVYTKPMPQLANSSLELITSVNRYDDFLTRHSLKPFLTLPCFSTIKH